MTITVGIAGANVEVTDCAWPVRTSANTTAISMSEIQIECLSGAGSLGAVGSDEGVVGDAAFHSIAGAGRPARV